MNLAEIISLVQPKDKYAEMYWNVFIVHYNSTPESPFVPVWKYPWEAFPHSNLTGCVLVRTITVSGCCKYEIDRYSKKIVTQDNFYLTLWKTAGKPGIVSRPLLSNWLLLPSWHPTHNSVSHHIVDKNHHKTCFVFIIASLFLDAHCGDHNEHL